MVYATEVYQWFKELAAHSRIEFACSLMHLCIPSELRFISTLLEDMNNKDYPSLRDTEDSCNNPIEFSQYQHGELNSEHVHKLCISLSLLKPTNQILAQMIYEILRIHFDYLSQSVLLKGNLRNEIMLLYALASHHPAFTFQCRHKLAEYFTTLLNIHDCDSSMSLNCNNSALKEQSIDICQHKIVVSDVKIERTDAIIIVEIVSLYGLKKFVTKRQCLYSQIKNTIGTIFSKDNDIYRTMDTLTLNGSFTRKNVSDIVTKIILFSGSESNQISLFFLHLPTLGLVDKSLICLEKCRPANDTKVIVDDCSASVFQNDQSDLDSSANSARESSKQCSKQPHNNLEEAPENSLANKNTESNRTSSVVAQSLNLEQSESYEKLAGPDEADQEPCESAYLEQVLMPLNILGSPFQPFYQYYLPSYGVYGQSKSSYVLSPGTALESASLVDGSSKATLPYLADCSMPAFFSYNLHQTQFRSVRVVPSFQISEPFTSHLSNSTSSFLLSNVVSRPQSATTTQTTNAIMRQPTSHLFPNPTS